LRVLGTDGLAPHCGSDIAVNGRTGSYCTRHFLSEVKDTGQRLPITWTACHFGGRRPWFICSARVNGRYCGRRVAVLYLGGEVFACRKCCGLAYES
jgi:hypothetical protein